MADASDLTEFGEIFSDYDPETEQLNTLDDANDAMYDLLGMSPENKEKAHKELAEEDKALGGTDGDSGSSDSSDSDAAPSDKPEEKELTMKEKAEAEALEYMRQANAAASEEASGEDTSNEEDRLNNMLDDIFSEEEVSASEAPSATEDNSSIAIEVEEQVEEPAVEEAASETPVDSTEPEVSAEDTESTEAPSLDEAVPEVAEQPEVSAPEEGAISSISDVEAAAITTDEPQVDEGSSESIDAIEHMNSIIDSAASTAEVSDMPGLDGSEIASIPDAPESKAEFKVDISNVDMGELNNVDISDDLLNEIDLTEDLTNGLNDETDLMNDDSTLSKRQLKKKQKAEMKAAKKAAKEAKKLEKAAKKLKPEEKDPNDIIADIEEAFANDDVVGTMEKVAQSGVEGAAEESLQDVDLNQFIGDDGGGEGEAEEKKSFKEKMVLLLFGPPEEGDFPTEEELAAKKAAKEAKIAAKEQAKEEKEQKKKEAQEAKALKKSQAKEVAVVKKAAAKDKKAKIAAEEEAEDAKEKKINPKQVVTTFVILAVLAATVVLGTNEFNYHMVIARATNYFEMQKYRKAYDQIVGVDIKDRDQEIKDKILCVMYVQQQIDSYNNFTKLEMYENALDSLIKGIRKYNEHYEEAKAMGISSDLDGLHATIEKELMNKYGLSMEVVNAWTKLDQEDYTTTVLDYVAHMNLKENNSMSMINDDFLFTFD